MFVQIVRGKAKDEAGMRKQFDRWQEEIRPNAVGFLGSTSGIAEDGTFITIARFQSEEVAKQNSDSPEQSKWWSETEPYLSDVSFADCTEVQLLLGGGSNDAGFVQIIEGDTKDKDKVIEMGKQMEPMLQENRPDVLGGLVAWDGDKFVQVMYFKSEKEAREREANPQNEGPPEEWSSLFNNVSYTDISDPQLI